MHLNVSIYTPSVQMIYRHLTKCTWRAGSNYEIDSRLGGQKSVDLYKVELAFIIYHTSYTIEIQWQRV